MSELDPLGAALADCLDALEQGEKAIEERLAQYPAYADELGELLRVAQRLRPLGELSPRREFAEAATEQLVARLGDRGTPWRARIERLWQTRLPVFQWRTGAALSGLGILVIIAMLAGGVLYTAAAAGPGDPLYGLNLRLEQVQLSLARNPEVAARIHLDLASKRLRETGIQVERGDVDHALAALEAFEKEIGSVARLVRDADGVEHDILLGLLSDAQLTHLEALDSLLARAPEGARAAIEHAIELLVSGGGRPVDAPGAGPTEEPKVEEPAQEASPPTALPVPTVEPGPPTTVPAPTEVVVPTAPPVAPPTLPVPAPVVPTVEPGPPADLPVPPEVVLPTVEPGPPATLPVPPNIPPRPGDLP